MRGPQQPTSAGASSAARRRRQARAAPRSSRSRPAPKVAQASRAEARRAAADCGHGRARRSAARGGADRHDRCASAAPSFRWPVRRPRHPGFGPKPSGEQNDGINVAVPEGTPVKAAEEGVVAYAGSELKGYGNLVLIRHANGFVTAYAHASELDGEARRHREARPGDRQGRPDRQRQPRRSCTSRCARARRRSIRRSTSRRSTRKDRHRAISRR